MQGDNQDYPVPQNMPPASPVGLPSYFATNPLQSSDGIAAPGYGPAPSPTGQSIAFNPLNTDASAVGSAGVSGFGSPIQLQQPPAAMQPALAAPLQPAQSDEGDTPLDDIAWINRTKRVIAENRNDPYRQVQLVQHLRASYLKQRFGRSVHTDGS